jgi:hypothetical protein
MNSLVPVGSNLKPSDSGSWIFTVIILAIVVVVCVGALYYFKEPINDLTTATIDMVTGYFSTPPPPMDISGNNAVADAAAPAPASAPAPGQAPATAPPPSYMPELSMKNAEKILSGSASASTGTGPSQVFNVSSNKYTYYDAEPLCKALGAELATYDQVKDAWNNGADWCNYGWVKGQSAVYPTQQTTYNKLQAGPEDQRMACGVPGVNGGYFDNPELRFGVNCYGSKPSENESDTRFAMDAHYLTPGALAYDKKVQDYKANKNEIPLNPFKTGAWSS